MLTSAWVLTLSSETGQKKNLTEEHVHHFHDDDVVDPNYRRANSLLENMDDEDEYRGDRPADKAPEKK